MGISASALKVTAPALRRIIDEYTMESGVRGLKRQISTLCRSVAVRLVRGEQKRITVTGKKLEDFLGKKRAYHDKKIDSPIPGVVTGLAYTSAGGEILFVEARMIPGDGELIITGQLGDVMKESVQIAVSLAKSLYPKQAELFRKIRCTSTCRRAPCRKTGLLPELRSRQRSYLR